MQRQRLLLFHFAVFRCSGLEKSEPQKGYERWGWFIATRRDSARPQLLSHKEGSI
jgi:hypothetical protein